MASVIHLYASFFSLTLRPRLSLLLCMAQLEDEASLFLWQRAVFMESDSDSSAGNRATADSLRLRLGQLEYLHYRE